MAKKQEDIVTPIEYKNNQFGKALSSFDAIKNDRGAYADIFSEGSPALKKLLLHLWENDIETLACCTGHTMQPAYIKKTFWGEKHIRESEFLENRNNKKYYRYIASPPGYLSFKLKNGENTSIIARQIENLLADKCPDVPCHVCFGMADIGIYMDHAVSEKRIENFFSAVSDAIDQSLNLQKTQTIETQTQHPLVKQYDSDGARKGKPGLAERIADAAKKSQSSGNSEQYVSQKQVYLFTK